MSVILSDKDWNNFLNVAVTTGWTAGELVPACISVLACILRNRAVLQNGVNHNQAVTTR